MQPARGSVPVARRVVAFELRRFGRRVGRWPSALVCLGHLCPERSVDQTAACIRGWIDRIGELPELSRAFDACAAFPGRHPVDLGVLRGGLADDGEWQVDPARPAVIVGTVDMVGSRLIFAGYGAGRSRRAMDAGLVGHDVVIVLDKAHLAPAMGELLRAVAELHGGPELQVMTLSALGAGGSGAMLRSGSVLTLEAEDLADEAVRRRLEALKTACFVGVASPADRIGAMCEAASAHRTGAIAVYVERVAPARRIAARLARAHGAERVAVLTGTLRGHERSALVGGAVWGRFAPERKRLRGLGGATQALEEHGRRVGQAIRRIGEALGLPGPLVEALVLAGEWHDVGKSRWVWRLAAGVPPGGPPLAKSRRGRFRAAGWLGGYRHEFASVAEAERALPEDTPHRDLILHLIAAHHGWARPGFPRPEQWDPEASPDANRALAERIADRYARLSAEHGPWKLAWLESLLKAADAWVSSGGDA